MQCGRIGIAQQLCTSFVNDLLMAEAFSGGEEADFGFPGLCDI